MSVDCVSDTIFKQLLWRGYEQTDKKANILAEIAETRIAFAVTRGVPADICIVHESVVGRAVPEEGFLVRTWTAPMPPMQPTVWYLGRMPS